MGSFSIWHWLIVLAVVLLLFGGKGKISTIMGDFGKGLKSFKKSMREDDEAEEPVERKPIDHKSSETASSAPSSDASAETQEHERDKAANG